jgi:uncharacterized membrane protein YdjX (TVP38/TMEM64 family)
MSRILEFLTSLQEKFAHYGWLGVLAYGVVMALAQVAIIPLSPLGAAAGAGFGFLKGWVAVIFGTNLGAFLNFVIARYFARGFVTRKLATHEKFRLIDAAINRDGWKMVALLRFVPVPFGVANYAFGLTGIGLVPYVVATFFATIPANTFIVWLGHTAGESLAAATGAKRPHHPAEYVFLVLGFIAAYLVLRHITKIAKSALENAEQTPPPAE